MRERRLTKRCTAKIIRIYDIDSIKKEKPSKKSFETTPCSSFIVDPIHRDLFCFPPSLIFFYGMAGMETSLFRAGRSKETLLKLLKDGKGILCSQCIVCEYRA